MEGLKRTNPFLDEEILKEVNKKVLTNPSEYVRNMEEEHQVEAMNCTLIHIGNL